jgi:hypothetical protein
VETGWGLVADAAAEDSLLAAALRFLALLVRRAALEQRLLGIDPNDPYRGLLLSDEEIDHLLHTLSTEGERPIPFPELQELQEQQADMAGRLSALGHPPDSRLGRLLDLLGLSPLDRDILLLAMLVEIDPRYGRLLAYLQDDVTRPRPSIFLALRLLGTGEVGRAEVRSRLRSDAPLCRHRLISLEGWPADPTPPWLQQAIRVDRRVVTFLVDGKAADEVPLSFVRRVAPGRPLAALHLDREDLERLRALLPALRSGEIGLVLLEGAAGSGRYTAACALARELDQPLLEMLPQGEPQELFPLEQVRLAQREACLQGAVLFCRDGRGVSLADWGALAAEYGRPTLLGGERFGAGGGLPTRTIRLPMSLPNAALRRELWTEYLADSPHQVPDLAELASRFRLNAGQIRDAAAWAAGRARGRGQEAITMADLEDAVAFVVMPTLDGLARPIPPRHTWDELILPPDVKTHLREFSAAIRRRDQVYDTWGFDRRRPMGRGLNALFAGPSGTGKTMAAEIIAGELGLPIFKIDLSAVVSKYIGETEKHLRRLFAEAEQANAILFFDEADALFGKRSEVRDAHDRYANIEVAYLLQALEEHAGVAILATNLFGNLDDAFVRRVHFIVHFPFPDEDMRRRIWEVIFPAEAPLASDVDRADLARRFRITGGHIRNIALGGAFLAADDGAPLTPNVSPEGQSPGDASGGGRRANPNGAVIRMDHLLRAARREFQKMGKIIEDADFAPAEA